MIRLRALFFLTPLFIVLTACPAASGVKNHPGDDTIKEKIPLAQGGAIQFIDEASVTYEIHTFEYNAAYSQGASGQASYSLVFTDGAPSATADVLVVAGGGGGGGGTIAHGGGGGGGGGVVYAQNVPLVKTPYSALVGRGGAGGAGNSISSADGQSGFGDTGKDSWFEGVSIARGGGGGAMQSQNKSANGIAGSSGGGATGLNKIGGQASFGSAQGWKGGGSNGFMSAAGGGGAGGAAPDVSAGYTSGNGGDSLPFDISGTQIYYGGGGAGGIMELSNGSAGASASGGQGSGGDSGQSGFNGGGGGGGGMNGASGGAGGGGVIIVRFIYSQ